MKFDLGEVLGRMWKIGWNHKVLWLWQMLPSLAIIFIFPSVFIYYPIFMRLIQDSELKTPIEPWMSISLNSMWILFGLAYILMWIFAQLTTTYGAIEIEKGIVKISFRELFHKSFPYIWRVLGLYFLYGGMWALGSVSFQFVFKVVYKDVSAFPKLLLTLMSLPLTIAWFVSICVLELAQASIVVNNAGVVTSVSHAWRIFKNNWWRMGIFMIILYFVLVIPWGLLLMPFFTLVPMSALFLSRVLDTNVIFFTVFFGIVPLIVILPTSLSGFFMMFFQSAWAVTYLRLSNNANVPVIAEGNP